VVIRPADGACARATAADSERAREVVPTPELVPPTPAKESTLQSSSRHRFSPGRRSAGTVVDRFWHLVLWLAQLLEREGGSRGSSGACWAGLAVLVAVALGTEAVLVQDVWPWLMHHDLHLGPGATLMAALPLPTELRRWRRRGGEAIGLFIASCRWAMSNPRVRLQLAIAAAYLLATLAVTAFMVASTLTALGRPVNPPVVAGGAVLLSGVLLVAAGIDQWRRGR
jgi:hypothetical protein